MGDLATGVPAVPPSQGLAVRVGRVGRSATVPECEPGAALWGVWQDATGGPWEKNTG